MNEGQLQHAHKLLHDAQKILILSHVRPDGDAVGSVLGLGLALQEVGKQVQMVLADGVPGPYRHLPGADEVRKRPEGESDLIVILDSSDLKRLGEVLAEETIPDINIDHHVTNLNFAKINLVDTAAVATAAILAENLPRWGLPVTRPVAAALLTGILTDTQGFRTSNMTSHALRLAADLIDAGADLSELYARALAQRSFQAARLWGAGLARLQRQGCLIWTTLTHVDRLEIGYTGRDDADLVNFLSTIQDCQVAVIFVEQPDGTIKVSWRAQPGFDVAEVAMNFGGGGHPSAAGAEIEGDLESVQKSVLEETRLKFSLNEKEKV